MTAPAPIPPPRLTVLARQLRRRWPAWIALLVLLPLLGFGLHWVAAVNLIGIDEWFERQYVEYLEPGGGATPFAALRALYLETGSTVRAAPDAPPDSPKPPSYGAEPQAWRAFHAKLLDALVAAGARVVAFDFDFDEPVERFRPADAAFIAAIERARQSDTRVVIAAEGARGARPDGLGQAMAEALRPDEWGLARVGGERQELSVADSYLRRVPLAEANDPGTALTRVPAVPSLALQIVLAWLTAEGDGPATAFIEPGAGDASGAVLLRRGATDLLRVPCEIERDSGRLRAVFSLLRTVDLSQAQRGVYHYPDVYGRLDRVGEFAGTIVLVGTRTAAEKKQLSTARAAYGYEIHATVASDLLAGRWPRRPGAVARLGLLALLTLLAVAAAVVPARSTVEVPLPWLGKRALPVALFAVLLVYLLAAVLAYRFAFVIVAPAYHLLVMVIGYAAARRLLAAGGDEEPPSTPAAPAAADEENPS